jgi:phosphate transport system substrate-binding protein
MTTRTRWAAMLAGICALMLGATACSSDGSTTTTGSGGGDLTGSLNISGSSTVEPITSLVAEKFQGANGGVDIAVDGPGTSDGFQLFCKGETDINDASRQIEPEEKTLCKDNGVSYVELAVGQDALSVIGNPADPLECLALGDLYALFGPESEGIDNWSAADNLAKEVGGNGGFPDEELTIVAPGEESGTYGSFIDLAIKSIAEERGQPDDQLRKDYQASADDNVIVDNAEGSAGALGFVGYAYAQNAAGQVKEFQIDGGGGCVAPSPEAVNDGTYPLSRTLYIYVSKEKLADSLALKAFVDFYLSADGIASVTETQYIALHPDDLQASRDTWAAEGSA